MLTPYMTYIKIAGVVIIFLAGLGVGYSHEHEKLVVYKTEVAQLGKDQAVAVTAINLKNQGDANEAQDSYTQAINGVNQYYRAHPVIRVQNTCGSTLPKTAGNTPSIDGSTPSSDAGAYISKYSPLDTELIAERLNALQQLLRADGVTISQTGF